MRFPIHLRRVLMALAIFGGRVGFSDGPAKERAGEIVVEVRRTGGWPVELPDEGEPAGDAVAYPLDQTELTTAREAVLFLGPSAFSVDRATRATYTDSVGRLRVRWRAETVALAVVARGCAWKIVNIDSIGSGPIELSPGGEVSIRVIGPSSDRVFLRSTNSASESDLGEVGMTGERRVIGIPLGCYQFGLKRADQSVDWAPSRSVVSGSIEVVLPVPPDRAIVAEGRVRGSSAIDFQRIDRLEVMGTDSTEVPFVVPAKVDRGPDGALRYSVKLPRAGFYRITELSTGWSQVCQFSPMATWVDFSIPESGFAILTIASSDPRAEVRDPVVRYYVAPVLPGSGILGSVGSGGVSSRDAEPMIDGRFRIRAPAGRCVISVQATGFILSKRAVIIREAETTQLEVRLRRAE